MTSRDGKVVSAHVLDVVALAEERYPGARLLGVMTTLVLREPGGAVRFLNVMKEKQS